MRQHRRSKRRLIRRNQWQKLNWKAITAWIPIQKRHILKKLKVLPSRSAPSSSSPPAMALPHAPPLMKESEDRGEEDPDQNSGPSDPFTFSLQRRGPRPPTRGSFEKGKAAVFLAPAPSEANCAACSRRIYVTVQDELKRET